MQYRLIVLALLLCAVAGFSGEERTPWIESVKAEQRSATNKILVEEYTYSLPQNEGYRHEIWLVSAADASLRRLLFTHQRYAEVVFSPDDQWLVVNDHLASNESDILLFRQKKGIEFEEQKERLGLKAWAFLEKKMKRKAFLDHNYAEVLRWTDDHTVLLCLHGHLDSKNHVEDWLCLYDVNTKTFSTDLDAHNRRHTVLEPGRDSL